MTRLVTGLDRTAQAVVGATLAGALLLAVLGWMFVVSPKRSHAAELKDRVALAQAQLAEQRSQQSPESGLTPTDVRQLELAMPDSSEMSTLVRQLDRLARRADVTLDSVTPAAESGGSGYSAIPLTVVVDGKFFRISRFLGLVRNQVRVHDGTVRGEGRLFDVQALDVEQSTTPRQSLRATLTMQAYVYAGGSKAATAETTASARSSGTNG
jgi:Tfp pilus assembly protein PilO